MILPSQVWLALEVVDMRLGIDGLSRYVQDALGCAPSDGSAYAFRNRRNNRIKLLIWDGTGVWLCQRRLHTGHFHWVTDSASHVMLDQVQWEWLTKGLEWQRLAALPKADWLV